MRRIDVPRTGGVRPAQLVQGVPVRCPSCGVRDVKRLELICELCRALEPEHISTIVPRVMDEIERKGKAA